MNPASKIPSWTTLLILPRVKSPCPANGSRSVADDAEVEFLFSVGLSALVSYKKEKRMVLGLPCYDRAHRGVEEALRQRRKMAE
ncbi:hypothetical protein MUK42_33178 [Musa troglodytarum]|uniref:Uncharacterized protein n=1 Tax=Musa troglodytarum TaxID=320322 RepID=A0A9E7FAQ7_9LILI|nr:hypothetical protein MUK42_33178 [Musa troglodytarum]